MGYSCSARARYTLDQVDKLDEFDIKSNSYKYFIELGRENADGAITGTVYELVYSLFVDKDLLGVRKAKKGGTFRIESDGSIKRFHGVPKNLFGVLRIAGAEAFYGEYEV